MGGRIIERAPVEIGELDRRIDAAARVVGKAKKELSADAVLEYAGASLRVIAEDLGVSVEAVEQRISELAGVK